MSPQDLLPLFAHLGGRRNGDTSLHDLSRRSGWSPFHLQRVFRRLAGETPKQYTLRLRLERGAGMLVADEVTVADTALACGFASHEVFTRAFRRRFGCSPVAYRADALREASVRERKRHAALVHAIGPCIGLYYMVFRPSSRSAFMTTLSIERQELEARPILFIRRRIARSELQGTLAECFGKLYGHAQRKGLALAGFPLARYVSTGPGLWTVEAAIPLSKAAAPEDDMQAGSLPAGPVALGIHVGPYEGLGDTNAAIERWIEANGFRVGGPPWEWYVTDPGEHPDPRDWRTEVYWPLAE